MIIYFRLFKESANFAWQAITENKLRTFLSLLGITIGIFAIISVYTMVDSIRNNINKSIASLGENTVYIQKWPWEFSDNYPWWKYMNRPVPQLIELEPIKERSKLAESVVFLIQAPVTFKYESASAENVQVSAVSEGYEQVKKFEVERGRYLSEAEIKRGRRSVVIGAEVATQLFGESDPVGRNVFLRGDKVQVVGVFKREGQNLIDLGLDNTAIIPLSYARNVVDIKSEQLNPFIIVKAKEGVSNKALMEEITGVMRGIRRLAPKEEDNFALNESKLLSKGFEGLIGIVNVAGGVIGFFSILVGGFGIANIMFVSVKERTNIIGIQKALGAKNAFILMEFLLESILLCLIGGAIGLLLIFLMTILVSNFLDFSVSLSTSNIVLGLAISSIIGLISGLAPAISASRLDPVEAMRSK